MADSYSTTVKILTDTSAANKSLKKFIADAQKQTIKINAQVSFNQAKMKSDVEKQLAGVTKGVKFEPPKMDIGAIFDALLADSKKVSSAFKTVKERYEDIKSTGPESLELFPTTDTGKLTTVFAEFKKIKEDIEKSTTSGTAGAVQDIATTVSGSLGTVSSLSDAIEVVADVSSDAADSVSEVAIASGGAAVKASILGSVLSAGTFIAAAVAMKLVVAGINMAAQAISNYIHRHEIAVAKAKELTDAFQSQADTLKNNKSTINSLSSEFDTLSKGVSNNGANISLSADEFERYHDIVNEICGLSPSLAQGYDAEGNAIANKNTLIKEAIKLQEEEEKYNLSRMTTTESNITVGKGAVGEYKIAEKEAKKNGDVVVSDLKNTLNNSFGSYASNTSTGTYASTNMSKIMSKENVQSFADTFELDFKANDTLKINGTSYLDQLLSSAENVQKVIDSLTDDPDKFKNILPEGTNTDKLTDDLIEYAHSLQEVEAASKAFNQQLLLNAQDSPNWDNLSSDSQNFVAGYVSNNRLTGNETEEDFAKINRQMNTFVSSIKNSPTAQVKISDLIELQSNSDDYSVDAFIQQSEQTIDEIVDELGLDKEATANIKLQMKASLDDTKKLQSDVESKLKEKGFDSQLDFTKNLNASELKLYYEILSDPNAKFDSPEDLQREFGRQDYIIKATAQVEVDKSAVSDFLSDTNEVFDMLSSGKSISLDALNTEGLKEYQGALKVTNGMLQLNAEKVREIAAARGKEKIATMEVAKSDLQNKYHQSFQAISKLNDQLKTNKNLTGDEIASIKKRISGYKEANSAIGANIDQYKIMINGIREANSDYQAFLSSQGATTSGQMYSDADSAMDAISKGFDSKKTGTTPFKSAVRFVMPEIDPTNTDAVKAQYQKLKRYIFSEDDDETGALNFKKDLLALKDVAEIDEDGVLKIADGISAEDIAKKLEIAPAVVQSLFGLLEDYGTEIDFGTGFFDDPMAELFEVERKLTETSDLIDGMADGSIEVDDEKLDAAEKRLDQLNKQKADLTAQSLDLYVNNEEEISEKQKTLDAATKARDEYDGDDDLKKITLQADVEEAELALDTLEEKKETLIQPTAMDIKLAVEDIDAQIAAKEKKLTNNPTKDKKTNEDIKDLKATRAQYLKIDTTEAKTEIDGVQGFVDFLTSTFAKPNKIEVDNAKAINDIGEFQGAYDAARKHILKHPMPFPILSTFNIGGNDGPPDDKSDAGNTGVVKVMGDALVGGMNNRTQRRIRKKYKSTLVGELGREIVVDPHSGNWYTVGDRGAEMVVLPRNALVFNHKQTEDLLGKQSISSRARAVNGLGGLAFAKGNTKTDDKSGGKDIQTIDWFEKSIDRLNKTISLLTAKLSNSSAIKTLVTYTKLLIRQQTKVLSTYSKAVGTYKSQYTKDLKPLSKADQKKIKSGNYKIEDFDVSKDKDKTRKENIEKALDSKSKYDDSRINLEKAKTELMEYSQKLAEIPWNKAQEAIEKLNQQLGLLDSQLNNAVGYKNKNKIIDEKVKVEQDKVNEQKKAAKESQKVVDQSKKNIDKRFKGKYSKQTQNEKKISIKGLKGEDLAAVIQYNANIEANRKNKQEVDKGNEDLKTTKSTSAKQKFDNITDHYQLRAGNISARDKKISNEISLAEAKGQQIGTSFYSEQARFEQQNQKYLQDKKAAQKKAFDEAVSSGKVKMYSEDWYKMRDAMYETDQQIQQSNLSIIELGKKVRELQWKNFDKLMDQFSDLVSESDFLINLMSNRELINEDGSYTAEGLATQGQHAYNYDVYMAQSDNLLAEINKINADTTDQAALDHRNQLIKQRREAIKSAEAEKKAIIDLKQKGIQAEINAMKELIDEKKKALDSEKELRDYQKSIAEKTKNIARLQKQIKALEGDDSQENKKKLRELKAKLASAQEDLTETTEKKAIDDEKEALDKSLEEFTKKMEDYSKDTDKIFLDSLTTINAESAKIAETLQSTASAVGYSIDKKITDAWKSAGNSVSAYSNSFMTSSTGVLSVLNDMRVKWDEVAAAAERAAKASIKQTQTETVTGSDPNYTATKKKVENLLKTANGTGAGTSELNKLVKDYNGKQLSYANMAELAGILGIKGVTTKNIINDTKMKNKILEELEKYISAPLHHGLAGFSTGGIVEKAMVETARSNGDTGFATLRAGETVLTEDFTRMLPYAVEGMKSFSDIFSNNSLNHFRQLSNSELSQLRSTQADSRSVSIDVNAPLIHCDKFDADFVRDLQRNTNYQNAILDLVWSPVTDGKTHRINRNR